MKQQHSSKLILLGYAFLALFLFINIQFAQNRDTQIETHYIKLSSSEQQLYLIQQLQLHAKSRSIMLGQIVFEKDPFIQEEYIQQMVTEGLRFGRTRTELLNSDLTSQQKQHIEKQRIISGENRLREEEIVSLILDKNADKAAQELFLATVPVQNKVIESLSLIAKDLYQNSLKAKQNYQTVLSRSEFYARILQMSLLLAIVLLGIFSFKQARQNENRQQKKVKSLTKKMQDQAYANKMDAHILHAVDEYIVLVDKHGQFIRTNPSMESILRSTHYVNTHTIWQLLDESSNQQINISEAKKALIDNNEWKNELFLLSPFECFALCEISRFSSKDIPEASHLLVIKDITELKETQEAVEIQANYDAVTELPNRHFFQKTLAKHTQKPHASLAVFYIDLDDFKNINDTLGHHFGDELLNAVSHRMYNLLLENFLHNFHLARIGGDEFSVILTLEEKQLAQQSELLADKLIKVVSQPYDILDHTLEIGCSIGIALFPQQGNTATKLMRHADLAMYEAKHNGKNKFVFFDNRISQKLEQKLILKQRLETALRQQEFILHYQPQYDLKTNKIIGLEALIRWQSDEVCYTPDEFIPFAEQNGFIHLIDEYVINLACQQIDDWNKQGLIPPRVAINISSQQINSNSLLELVNEKLTQYKLLGSVIELEITEYSLVESIQKDNKQENWLNKLRDQGIHIAIDDFGTGYSSLSYLQHMPVNRLKIDRSFIQNITKKGDNQGIVESIISLGHNVNASVLAEGIETEEQYQMLISLGCDEGQGYLMSKPLPVNDITQLLQNNH